MNEDQARQIASLMTNQALMISMMETNMRARADLKEGPHSVGEFGSAIERIISSAKALSGCVDS